MGGFAGARGESKGRWKHSYEAVLVSLGVGRSHVRGGQGGFVLVEGWMCEGVENNECGCVLWEHVCVCFEERVDVGCQGSKCLRKVETVRGEVVGKGGRKV